MTIKSIKTIAENQIIENFIEKRNIFVVSIIVKFLT